MPYLDSPEQANHHGEQAFGLMREHAVPLSPENYEIWYEYAAGRNQDLVKALDALLEDKLAFTPERSHELHERYIQNPGGRQEIDKAYERLERLLSHAAESVSEGAGDQNAYCERLSSLSDSAEDGSLAPASLVQNILSETRAIVAKGRAIAEQLGESTEEIEQLRRNLDEVRQQAQTDALTGIANRSLLDSRLRLAIEEAYTTGQPLSLIMGDIDHFKSFNDTYGHHIGDKVLKVTASVIKQNVKGRDLAARYGGEEFCIVLPATPLEGAVSLAEKIRRMLADHRLANKKSGQSYGRITMSLGVATWRAGETPEDLTQRADQSLYAAKRGGRNKVVQEEEEGEGLSLSA